MRLSALVAITCFWMNPIFAQLNESPVANQAEVKGTSDDFKKWNHTGNHQLNKKLVVSDWYDYTNALVGNGEKINFYSNIMWPDSLPTVIYSNGSNNVNLHSVGAVFDPKSPNFLDPTPALSQHNAYTIDSINFNYKYFNRNGITDTLLIQFYGNNKIETSVYFGTPPNQVFTRTIVLNRAKSMGQSATSQIKVLLDSTYNTPNFFGTLVSTFNATIRVPTPLIIPKNGLGAFTITFIPGNYPVALGDTIAFLDSINLPFKKLNSFATLTYNGDGVASNSDTSYNIGLFAYSREKYSTRSTEWYFPGNPPGFLKLSLISAFYITSNNVGINEVSKILKIYPNPISAGSRISFEGVNGSFDYFLTDVQGRVIDQGKGSAGELKIADDIASGTYYLQLVTKETSYKASLVIP